MTAPTTGPGDQPEAATVIVIDLRASATGPDAATPGSIDQRTLEERQRQAQRGGVDDPSGWRIINFERLLVVDDAAEFARHEDDYRYLIEAPTFGRMLCLVTGATGEPPYLDVPKAAVAARSPVVWLGDARGVGWRIGWANTTRLAFSDSDPDGTATVANLIESLSSADVFDEIARAASDLPGRTGVPAVLPWVPWPLSEPAPARPDRPPEPVRPAPPPVAGPPRVRAGRRRTAWLLALGCLVIAIASGLAIRFGRHHPGFVVADIGGAVVILLAIALRLRRRRPAPVPPPPKPAAEQVPPATPPPSEEFLARARWMMDIPVADEAFRQLSSPEQLVMLNGDPGQAKLVRFAPACAEPLIGGAVDDGSIRWIPAGDQLGVVRLVSMKAGLVRPRGG